MKKKVCSVFFLFDWVSLHVISSVVNIYKLHHWCQRLHILRVLENGKLPPKETTHQSKHSEWLHRVLIVVGYLWYLISNPGCILFPRIQYESLISRQVLWIEKFVNGKSHVLCYMPLIFCFEFLPLRNLARNIHIEEWHLIKVYLQTWVDHTFWCFLSSTRSLQPPRKANIHPCSHDSIYFSSIQNHLPMIHTHKYSHTAVVRVVPVLVCSTWH